MKKIIKVSMVLMVLLVLPFVRVKPLLNASYVEKSSEFRAAWVSNFIGSVSQYTNETSFKKELNEKLDILEYYNINVMIFHIRTHNNALYKSELNPIATWWKNVDFDEFDPLEWLIEECHRRGIEFHAWLNPYRVSKSYCGEDYPSVNPASKEGFVNNGILDPGIPSNRDFIVDTCMEIVENYNVDAIHFDDYFYVDNFDDTDTYNKYKSLSTTTNKADWRREQVDLFIEKLHKELKKYNEENGKYVQLGISPSGIYKNGNGKVEYDEKGWAITTGSDTRGFAHYGDYLYSDTLKWCNLGYIDYILPQSYWAQTHTAASYQKVMGWWDKALKNINVNLYSGIGIYMANSEGSNYSWGNNLNELVEQLSYINTLPKVSGAALYSFNYIDSAYKKKASAATTNIERMKESCWTKKVLVPEIVSATPKDPGRVEYLLVQDNFLTWKENKDAKFYVIYRSKNNVTFSDSELYDIVGGSSVNGEFTYNAASGEKYNYGIKCLSYTNTLGEGVKEESTFSESFKIETDTSSDPALNGTEVKENGGLPNEATIKVGYTRMIFFDSQAPSSSRLDYNLSSSNEEIATISKYGTITALKKGTTTITAVNKQNESLFATLKITVYENKEEISKTFNVTFKDHEGNILKEETVEHSKPATAPSYVAPEGFEFVSWDKDFSHITSDLIVSPTLKVKQLTVTILNHLNEIVVLKKVPYNSSLVEELQNYDFERTGYIFQGFDKDITKIKEDMTISPLYEIIKLKVTFKDFDGNIIEEKMVDYGSTVSAPSAPLKEGYEFKYWDGNLVNIVKDEIIVPYYKALEYSIIFLGEDSSVLSQKMLKYGEKIIAPSTSMVENFARWDKEFDTVKEDLVISAICFKYLIEFTYNDEVFHSYMACEGDEIIAPDAPVKDGLVFKEYENIKQFADNNYTFKAVYDNLVNKVTFLDHNGNIIKEVSVNYGESAECEAPLRAGYEFVGWDNNVDNVKSDLTVKALYSKTSSSCNFTLSGINLIMALSLVFVIISRRRR